MPGKLDPKLMLWMWWLTLMPVVSAEICRLLVPMSKALCSMASCMLCCVYSIPTKLLHANHPSSNSAKINGC